MIWMIGYLNSELIFKFNFEKYMGKKVDKEAMLGLEFETKNNGKCFIIDYKEVQRCDRYVL